MASFFSHPLCCVQHDWEVDVKHKTGKFWVSCRLGEQPSHHGYVKVAADGKVSGTDEFQARFDNDKNILELKHPSTELISRFQYPSNTYKTPHSNSTCITCSPNLSLVAIGDSSGVATICDIEGTSFREIPGHVATITCLNIFPSNKVLLTGSSDMSLRISSIEDGRCGAVIKGHTSRITDTAIIGVGRNILSSSNDRTVRRWECGTQQCVSRFDYSSPVLGIAMQGDSEHIATALSSSSLSLIDLSSNESSTPVSGFQHEGQSLKASSFCQLSNNVVAVGTTSGHIMTYDLRNASASNSLSWFRRSSASITALKSASEFDLVASTEDGTCFMFNYANTSFIHDMTGSNLDSILDIASVSDSIISLCKDQNIRVYSG